jgi:carboxymethylenebutenolidase
MTTDIAFASKSGGELHGARSEPKGSGKVGGVVVVQEWWGLSDHIKDVCDRLANAGLLALAPDLYHGHRPATKDEAAKAMGALDKARAVAEIGDAIARLKSDARCTGKVAVTGFCLGGALTLASACALDGIAAAVPFYGIPDLPMESYARIKAPVQGHFAKKDDWAKATVAEEIQKRVVAAGGTMDVFVYDAGHAFMRSTDADVHDPSCAGIAWDRAVAFLEKHLG